MIEAPRRPSRRALVLAVLVAVLATWLHTAGLGARLLWQDEAACALLGERLLEHGAPLGWADGVLITMDTTSAADLPGLDARTRDAESAVRYFTERGDFKDDTTWTGQPWGSIALAGIAVELLGRSATAARLPFALCGAGTALALFLLVRRRTGRDSTALLAALVLLANVFWLLHARQCRYYAPAGLLLVTTLAAYLRWCDGRRLGGPLLVASALAWFHVDFGSTVPGLAVLGAHALAAAPRPRKDAALVFGALALGVLHGAFFYELLGRHKPAEVGFGERLGGLAFLANRYLVALPLVLVCGALLLRRARRAPRTSRPGSPDAGSETRLVGLALSILLAELAWMSAVAPAAFFRYLVDTAPLAALVTVWTLERLAAPLPRPAAATALLAVLAAATPWLARPLELVLPASVRLVPPGSPWIRDELTRVLPAQLAGAGRDPNRAAVEFLAPRLGPDEEVLVRYEDLPLAFHLDRPVRGGIPCFRVEAPGPPPRFAVLRRSAGFVPGAPYERALNGHRWRPHELDAPDIAWGNNPDPRFHWTRLAPSAPPLVVLERMP